MSLTEKVAIMTGGNSGIGMAVVRGLATQGAKVVINYIVRPEATAELAKQIEAAGGQAIGVRADVGSVAELQSLVDAAVSAFGRVDIMVNNAGVETRTSLLETTEEQYDRVLGVNLKSAFFGSQMAARQMIRQGGGGRIINITSVHEDWPMPDNIAYCLSKGGMRMLTRTAGLALLRKLDEAIPLGRLAQPEEIASVVAFLAADGASYMTATTVFADGGLMHSSPGL
jgi:glucose 1-dehydrogenase